MTNKTAGQVQLNGHIDVPADRMKAVAAALPQHIALTRSEEGCISFNVTPSDTVNGRFIVSETFADQAAFDAHQTRTKNSPWAEITQGIPREYVIEVTKG